MKMLKTLLSALRGCRLSVLACRHETDASRRQPTTDNRQLTYALTAALAITLAACSSETPKPKEERVPVTVASAVQRDVPVQIRVIGNVQPYSTVAVRAQVGGQLTRVWFREGQDVRRGERLFTIDPRPYQAALAQAEANLARDEAQLKNAQNDATRYAGLVKKDFVTKQEYDKVTSAAEAAKAVVAADRAAAENARLQLAYCEIAAPIDGRTGSLTVKEGNIIKAGDTQPIVTINQVRPVYVQFAVPETQFAQVRNAAASLPVTAAPEGGGAPIANGKLTFVDSAVDTQTGTITLKATFPNDTRALWPGEFVQVAMTLSNRANAIVVPVQAVQNGQKGQYVYVVTAGDGVELRPVTVVQQLENQAVIGKGVNAGDTVVTDGQVRLTPKSKVDVKKSL
jgi:multidrug efflux system membrane fusion protein